MAKISEALKKYHLAVDKYYYFLWKKKDAKKLKYWNKKVSKLWKEYMYIRDREIKKSSKKIQTKKNQKRARPVVRRISFSGRVRGGRFKFDITVDTSGKILKHSIVHLDQKAKGGLPVYREVVRAAEKEGYFLF